jgi:nucleoid-associated protein YgaU
MNKESAQPADHRMLTDKDDAADSGADSVETLLHAPPDSKPALGKKHILLIAGAIVILAAVAVFVFLLLSKKSADTALENIPPVADLTVIIEEPPAIVDVPPFVFEEALPPVVEDVAPPVVEAPPAPKGNDIVYKVRWGDTLWKLAKRFYNDPYDYWRIAKHNGLSNANRLISGTTIRIPPK